MGVIEEVGPGVTSLSKGDRVVLPFNVACGFCTNCRRGKSAFCLTVNEPGTAGGAYGYVGMGPYPGGQAEYLRVPFADYNCVQIGRASCRERGERWVVAGSVKRQDSGQVDAIGQME